MNRPTKQTSIEELPPELINELFEYLHPKDLAACSLVNKRWYSIHAAFKLHRLLVIDLFDDDNRSDFSRWYDTTRPIQETDQCRLATFRRLAEKPLLSHLKHLAIYVNKLEFDLNELNRFQHLVHLEIKIVDLGEVRVDLKLPKLRVLVSFGPKRHCVLSIDCPTLSTLVYRGQTNLLDVKHPETIRKLDMNCSSMTLAAFKNVECLVTREFEAINKATLLSLPRLREVRYTERIESFFSRKLRNDVTIDQLKQTLSRFVKEAKKLRGNDFQFNFCAFQLTKVDVNQIDFSVEFQNARSGWTTVKERVYMKNYHLIEPGALDFVKHVDYTLLLYYATKEFPRCFSQKFTDVHSVNAVGLIKDPDHLLWFLKSLRSLKCLALFNTQLSQEFYDQLPASAPSLVTFYLSDKHPENELQLNFDFIGQFSRLFLTIVQPPLSFESATSLVRWLGKLAHGCFDVRAEGRSLRVEKKERIGHKIWAVKAPDQVLFETVSSEEMVNFFERL